MGRRRFIRKLRFIDPSPTRPNRETRLKPGRGAWLQIAEGAPGAQRASRLATGDGASTEEPGTLHVHRRRATEALLSILPDHIHRNNDPTTRKPKDKTTETNITNSTRRPIRHRVHDQQPQMTFGMASADRATIVTTSRSSRAWRRNSMCPPCSRPSRRRASAVISAAVARHLSRSAGCRADLHEFVG